MGSSVHPSPATDKATWREEMARRLKGLGLEVRQRETLALVRHLDAWTRDRGFTALLTTLPLEEEPDLSPFLERWLQSGRRLALARTEPERQLSFRLVDSLSGPWDTRTWGLREPPATLERWVAGPPSLCLVPGLAFWGEPGHVGRLGRGAGYYDRWLQTNGAHVTTVGIGFRVQWVGGWPMEAHDQTLDGWLGPDGIRTKG